MSTFFAICALGLEEATAAELSEMGFAIGRVWPGGVSFEGTQDAVAAANPWLRTIVRVLLRVAQFPATDRAALEVGLSQVRWELYAPSGVRASARKSRLRHTGLLEDAALEAAARRGGADGAGGEIYVRMDRDTCTVSVDMSGEPLHRRGWRQDVGAAPLRETLASALLRVAGRGPDEALIDPMCGSGVFPVEAASRSLGMPASSAQRRFAFEGWPSGPTRGDTPSPEERVCPYIAGADSRPEAVDAARALASRAGLAPIRWSVADAAGCRPPEGVSPGWVICNPPYGRRIEVAGAYGALGKALARFRGWRAAVICPQGGGAAHALERPLGRGPARVVPFRNGGLAVELRVYDRLGVRARSRRRRRPGGSRR